MLRGKSNFKKYEMVEDFITTYASEDDKKVIQEKFKRSLGDNLFVPQSFVDGNPKHKYPKEKLKSKNFVVF